MAEIDDDIAKYEVKLKVSSRSLYNLRKEMEDALLLQSHIRNKLEKENNRNSSISKHLEFLKEEKSAETG